MNKTSSRSNGFNTNALEVQYIHENGNLELFNQAYDEIFAKTWPEYVELDTPQEMLKSTDPDLQKFIMVVGKNLSASDPNEREIIAFRYAMYFPQSQSAMLTYLAVNPQYRGRGIGHTMVEMTNKGLEKMAIAHGETLKAVFFEIDDPAKTQHASGGLDPNKRKALFESWGGRQVPITYVRPIYNDDGSWQMGQEHLLMSYPINGCHPSSEDTVESMIDIHSYLTDNKDRNTLKQSPEIQAIQAQLARSAPVQQITAEL